MAQIIAALTIDQTEVGRVIEWSCFGEDFTAYVRRVVAACMECATEFRGDLPSGFIYDDPAGGWRQDVETVLARGGVVSGYCRACAARIAAADHAAYVNGDWERRTIEDETWVWAR